MGFYLFIYVFLEFFQAFLRFLSVGFYLFSKFSLAPYHNAHEDLMALEDVKHATYHHDITREPIFRLSMMIETQ